MVLGFVPSAAYRETYASLGCGMYPVNYPGKVLENRCVSCHADKNNRAPKIVGRALESSSNLTHPDKSLLLLAPLAKEAGGLGLCGNEFRDTSDPDYGKLLAASEVSAKRLRTDKRFDMEGFRPNRHYIREMHRFGILPEDLKPTDPIDIY